ncbi:MAG: hypothetical protein L0214_13235, partial [candidate division NC10 bacterium]|nr:hypothetical protein [candidate division NC10 bacterium]
PAAPTRPPSARPSAPAPGFRLSDEAMTKLGLKLGGEVAKWFLTPVEAPVSLSGESAAAWANYKLDSWGDYSAWADAQTPAAVPADFDVLANAEALDVVSGLAPAESGAEVLQAADAVGAGVVESAPVSPGLGNLGTLTAGLATAAALVDMGFTIAGDMPDAAKAVNAALDAVIIVGVWIPVYGWAIALVAGVVKGILGIFAGDLWGSGPSHEQREAAEANRALTEGASPFGREVGAALTPREALTIMIGWTSGYCGGYHSWAIGTSLINPDDPSVQRLGFGNNPCYWNTGHPYREWPEASAMTLDDQATALVKYAETDLVVGIQAGVSPYLLAGANLSLADLIKRKAAGWRQMMDNGLTLDGIDVVAAEQRKQPHLREVAEFFGHRDWHRLVQWHLQDFWTRYVVTNRQGSLQDFSKRLGYADWHALRDEVVAGYDAVRARVMAVDARASVYGGASIAAEAVPEGADPDDGLRARLDALRLRVETLEVRAGELKAAATAAATAPADEYVAAFDPMSTFGVSWSSP